MSDRRQLLCLDLGNTRLKGRLWRAGEPARAFALANDDTERLRGELRGLEPASTRVALCGVAPSRETAIRALCDDLKLPLWRVDPEGETPFAVTIRGRATLGADRLCNAAAAWAAGLKPAVVIDAGTAVTFDVIDATGAFAGGLIAPGRGLLARALAAGGEQLSAADDRAPADILGRDTAGALDAGVHFGAAAMAQGIVERLNADLGRDHAVVLTGGDAPALADLWRGAGPRLEPDWTLAGIRALAESVGVWR